MNRRIFLASAALLTAGCASPLPPPAPAFRSERISVTTRGSGPDVILISGLASLATEVWAGLVTDVPGYRYHLVQVAGFAGFPPGPNAEGPVVEPVAAEIIRYIDEQRLRPAVIGLSLGGALAMMVAARRPRTVSKLMVVDMVPFGGLFFGPPGTTPESLRPTAERIRQKMLTDDAAARRRFHAGSVDAMIMTERLRPSVLEHGLAGDQRVEAQAFYDLILQDLRPELRAITAPVTVLYVQGPHVSLDVPQTEALYRAAFANVPHAVLKRIPDAGHFIMLDQPEVFAREVRTFLR